jgi:signal peptidase I
MNPNLLENDHILVSKLSYGIRSPFTNTWLLLWSSPKRGDVVVFKHPNNHSLFFTKRIVAVAGDEIKFLKSGSFTLNGNNVLKNQKSLRNKTVEALETRSYSVILDEENNQKTGYELIPKGFVAVMGDNRPYSHDSRNWGLLNVKNIVGKVSLIWLSCDKLLSLGVLCNLSTLRKDRLGQSVH